MRLIDADALELDTEWSEYHDGFISYSWLEINNAPTIEPNLILPEQMERGDIYEVGETIVVMNHDDYYDLLCKSWVPNCSEKPNNCKTCKYGEDKHRYAHVCNECGVGINNYEPKDEPTGYNLTPVEDELQTDCAWR